MSENILHIGPSKKTSDSKEVKSFSPRVLKRSISKNITQKINQWLVQMSPIKGQEKVTFFRLLSTMINAGIPLTKSLHILKSQSENAHMKLIIENIIFQVENGMSFSEALNSQSKYFSQSQIGMVESGEVTGRLNEVLGQIADETEKSVQLNKKIKGAMIYPAVIILILIGALYAVMNFVMPEVKNVFDSLDAELPFSTQLLISSSDFATTEFYGFSFSFLALIFLLVLVGLVSAYSKTLSGKTMLYRLLMKLPVFGSLFKKTALARFCRSLSSLVGSGISILNALSITALSVENPVYTKRIQMIAEDVKRGITMAENMKDDSAYFPPMVVGMIGVAEQTAQIDQITQQLSLHYEQEVDDMVSNLSKLMEPIIIVILGLTVGFLVIAVMMPILQSSDLAFST